MMSWSGGAGTGFQHGDVPELVLGLSMSPTQPMTNCSYVADSERMPLIMAEWPWRAERDHLALNAVPSRAWSGLRRAWEAVSEDGVGMLAGCWGGVGGGEIMPGREDAWRVAVMGR